MSSTPRELDHVLELADVPAPVVGLEEPLEWVGERAKRPVVAASVAIQEESAEARAKRLLQRLRDLASPWSEGCMISNTTAIPTVSPWRPVANGVVQMPISYAVIGPSGSARPSRYLRRSRSGTYCSRDSDVPQQTLLSSAAGAVDWAHNVHARMR
jgi:hypothetical protein